MKTKTYEAQGGTIDEAVYNAMAQRWEDLNHKAACVVDTMIETFMDNAEGGYVPRIRYRVWVRDA